MLRHLLVGALGLLLAGCVSAKGDPSATMALTPPPAPQVPAGASVGSATGTDTNVLTKASPESPQRQMIYNATLQVVVPDIALSLKAIEQSAQSLGGYLQQLGGDSITVRVPAARLAEAMAAAEKLGQVTQRNIQGQDITEEMHDLQIRLDTALQMRQRLLALLEKADKTADALKVEQELDRVVQSIELLKGKIHFYQTQVAFSTLTVKLNSPLPQQVVERHVPIAWVRELADALVRGAEPDYAGERDAHGGPRFELPKSYIRYYGRDDLAEAMSASEIYIKVQRHDNYQGGDLDFWSTMARRSLVESRCIAIDKESDLTLRTKATAHLFVGKRQVAGKPYGYCLALISRKHEVYAFEAWGPADAFANDQAALQKAIESLDVDR